MSSLDASKLRVTEAETRTKIADDQQLPFGSIFGDHMLTVDWSASEGWGIPEIKPYEKFVLDPATCVFHYGLELFEGMKAYRTDDGKIALFRPEKNMERMNKSAARICLPTFDGKELIKMIAKLVELDKHMVPNRPEHSLYLRPVLMGTSVTLGVKAAEHARLFVITSPVGRYYETTTAISLEATDYATRAWPGGSGDAKLGGNYAPCVLPQKQAAERGYQQNLWLFGPEKYVTEVGSMNAFFTFKDATGKKELVTAPLDGTILPGVTRDSILALCRERLDQNEWTISERSFTITEVAERAAKGELLEAFGAGTAAIVSPIKEIGWNDQVIPVPLLPNEQTGPLTKQVAGWIADIQYRRATYKDWSHVVADLND